MSQSGIGFRFQPLDKLWSYTKNFDTYASDWPFFVDDSVTRPDVLSLPILGINVEALESRNGNKQPIMYKGRILIHWRIILAVKQGDSFGEIVWRKYNSIQLVSRPRESKSLRELSKEELARRTNNDPGPDDLKAQGLNGWRITDDTIAKCIFDGHGDYDHAPEAEALIVVNSHTSIPCPQYRGLVPTSYILTKAMLLMEYIPDTLTLKDAWPSLSIWHKLRVVWTVRDYVRQLHNFQDPRCSVPGPLARPAGLTGGSIEPYPCRHVFFPSGLDMECPFEDKASFTEFVLGEALATPDAIQEVSPDRSRFPVDMSAKFVFCHGDLSMTNILLDKNGVIWLIDYDHSGFYPPWFEYIGMLYPAEIKGPTPWLWRTAVPLMTGAWFEHEDWLRRWTTLLQPKHHWDGITGNLYINGVLSSESDGPQS
ncbi:hypothetical protein DL93DRAFT_2232176 [Clavulina sp. PMI_390]|nr:hypothetical protein DL93DRAFT_2232176 [Clavulina sp. PMI_390]